jgi:hypothetical protein
MEKHLVIIDKVLDLIEKKRDGLGRPSCPLRGEKRQGAKKTGSTVSTMLHGPQGLLLHSAH